MKHEKAFWESLHRSIDPGWRTTIPTNADGSPTVPLSEIDHYLYAYDSNKDWIVSAGLSRAEAVAMAAHLAKVPQHIQAEVPDAAAGAIKEAADAGAAHDSELSRRAMLGTLGAITLTQTFHTTESKWTPGMSLHFVYVLYRCADGSHICRPASVGSPEKRMLEPDHLTALIDQLVAMDTSGGDGMVQRQIKASGGAMLHGAAR